MTNARCRQRTAAARGSGAWFKSRCASPAKDHQILADRGRVCKAPVSNFVPSFEAASRPCRKLLCLSVAAPSFPQQTSRIAPSWCRWLGTPAVTGAASQGRILTPALPIR